MRAERRWPAIPYEPCKATCDTLHGHTQVLGKLAARFAPPEPQLQHAALRLTARGWGISLCPLPTAPGQWESRWTCTSTRPPSSTATGEDGTWRWRRIGRSVGRSGQVTRAVLAGLTEMVGPVPFGPRPQETPWSGTARRGCRACATYNPDQVVRGQKAARAVGAQGKQTTPRGHVPRLGRSRARPDGE